MQALDAIVTKIATYKEDASIFKISLAGAKGSADLNTEQEIELYDVLIPMQALEPGKLDELYETYPSLKRAHEMFPAGQYLNGTAVSYSAGLAQKVNRTSGSDQEDALFAKASY